MNFTYRDMVILLSMSLMVILMTFTFTAMGLGSHGEIQESEIPEFNSTAERFDMVGDFPDNPGSPSRTILQWNTEIGSDSDNHVWLDGDTNDGLEVFITDDTANKTEPEVTINEWSSGNASTTTYDFTQLDDYTVYENTSSGWELYITWYAIENDGETDETWLVSVEIRDQPGGVDWLERVPVLGGIYSATESVAGVVGWIGAIFMWFFGVTLEVIINLSLMLFNIMGFFVNFAVWLLTTYTAIITGVPNWVSVFISLPGVLIMLEFSKLILIGIKLLPTT